MNYSSDSDEDDLEEEEDYEGEDGEGEEDFEEEVRQQKNQVQYSNHSRLKTMAASNSYPIFVFERSAENTIFLLPRDH